MSRVWGSGAGGQCGKARLNQSQYCVFHKQQCERDEGLCHGRVDMPIPVAKLAEFNRKRERQVVGTSGLLGGGGKKQKVESIDESLLDFV